MIKISEIKETDKEWIADLLTNQWGSTYIVSRGKMRDASALKGFIATDNSKPSGLITYNIEGDECEIVTLNSFLEKKGIGSRLIKSVKKIVKNHKCKRIWLIETNDNTKALHFYQRRGFHLVTVYPNALEQSRKLKPEIPLVGIDNIPLRDEIELEILL
ncbi:GNAT family N-acetyltransferase [Candidatus Daviesbacteria bacterium]|nr:GNAT family N-acetyltransferase [Candidatus Daviesbacteria bacterium]